MLTDKPNGTKTRSTPRRRTLTALLALFCAISLSGCPAMSKVTATLTGSAVPYPDTPDPATATQKDVARLLARYKGALDTCNAQFPQGPEKAP